MSVRITTLCENTAGMTNLLAEFGLSVLIETDEANILFDTGQSISVCHNANILGIDLAKVDKVVLSHSHFDHTGGLRQVLLNMRKEVAIIAHPHVWAIKYIRQMEGKTEKYKFMGIPFQRQELENFGATFNLATEPVEITDNIMTTGEIPMITEFEDMAPPLFGGTSRFIERDDVLKPDEVLDDQALIINTKLGLVVVLGCSHRGMINTLHHARQLTGVDQIHTIVGGAHLLSVSEERVQLTINVLKKLGVQKIGLCHCTGMPAMALMAREFGDKFFFNGAGISIELP